LIQFLTIVTKASFLEEFFEGKTMKKLKALMLFATLLINGQALAKDKVGDIYTHYFEEHDNRTVIVMFHTDGNVKAAEANLISLMKTRDPGGFMNPYWIVDIPRKATNSKTGCGIIAGTWYQAGFPEDFAWEDIMKLSSKFTDLYAVVFSKSDAPGYKASSNDHDKLKGWIDMCDRLM
jgi:hypothetical protein